MLHAGGCADPLAADALRAALARGPTWIWVGDGAPSPLRRRDGLAVSADAAPTGLAIVDRDGRACAEVTARPDRLIGWVCEVWRAPARWRLDRAPWRQLLRRGAGPRAWAAAAAGAHMAARTGELARSVRAGADNEVAHLYAAPSLRAMYRELATAGLSEAERALAACYLATGGRLLDVGCGGGREAFGFAALGLEVIGIDTCPELIDDARRSAPSGANCTFAVMSLGALAFPDAHFDAVYLSSDVYASVPGRARRIAALADCRRILRPGGLLFLAASIDPPRLGLERLLVDGPRLLLGSRWGEPGDRRVRWAPESEAPDAFRHRFASRRELVGEIAEAGLAMVEWDGWFVAAAPPARRPTRYRRPADVAHEVVGGDALLVQLGRGAAFKLNGSGRTIFELASQGLSVAEIADRLHRETGEPADRLARDAAALLEQLAAESLLERRSPP